MTRATGPTIVWFRQDLRLGDNPALAQAAERGEPVVPLFVLDDETPGAWRPGGASRWWLHHSLAALGADLDRLGTPLVLRRGPAADVLRDLVLATNAKSVVWNRCYEPWAIARDTTLKSDLGDRGVEARSFNASLLVEPWQVETASGTPYRVFTPFWRAARAQLDVSAPLAAPARLAPYRGKVESDALDSWTLCPRSPDWAGGLRDSWTPGEAGARDRLEHFLDEALARYSERRDQPGEAATSRLSPHLHWGEIGPRQVWTALDFAARSDTSAEKFRSELGWREFSNHLLFHNPEMPTDNIRPEFDEFPWQPDAVALDAWKAGQTGVPLVDAGMRELWSTGWMHNRVRMIVASFLVKHLLQPWQEGARWFWDTLVDADLANNSASWQWVAGCGADAAPYFRVFNPVLQGRKFDPSGDYVRRWIPELGNLSPKTVHAPWEDADPPRDYPQPIVDLASGRRRALAAHESMKSD